MFHRLLIANRGEVAARVARACDVLGITPVFAVSEADRDAPYTRGRDTVVLGPARAAHSYLDPQRIVQAAVQTGCSALHPGWGFLSENPLLAGLCAAHGVTFVGPPAHVTTLMGAKNSAKRAMRAAGLAVIPGSDGPLPSLDEARRVAADPEVGRLRRLAAELGVADRVVFTGAVLRDDMPAMLRSADVVTCTPRYAEFGIVALEAMACGIPVVASALGGMLDTVVHDVTGRFVVPNRPRECAEALTGILRDSFLRRSLGLAGRDRVCARYSWDRVATDALRGYRRLVPAGVA